MDEHLENDVGVDLVRKLNNFVEFVASSVFVGLLSIDDVDQGATALESVNILHRELFCPWKVLDLKLDVWVVVYV